MQVSSYALHKSRGTRNPRATSLNSMLLPANSGIQHTSARLARLGHAQQNLEQEQPAFEVDRDEKVFLGVLASVLTKLRCEFRMGEQITDLIGATFYRVHQHACELVNDLIWNAPYGAGHHRFLLPQTFGHSQPEAFFQGLLNNDGG